MKMTITIDGEKIIAAYTGRTARIYREQFHKDLLEELGEAYGRLIVKYAEASEHGIEVSDEAFMLLTIDAVTPAVLEQIVWACVYPGMGSEYTLFEEWLDGIDDYNKLMTCGAALFHTLQKGPIVKPWSIATSDSSKKK